MLLPPSSGWFFTGHSSPVLIDRQPFLPQTTNFLSSGGAKGDKTRYWRIVPAHKRMVRHKRRVARVISVLIASPFALSAHAIWGRAHPAGHHQTVRPKHRRADKDAGENRHPDGAVSKKRMPSTDSIRPQDGAGGGTPSPRKLSEASTRIAPPRPAEATTIMGAVTLGRMWRSIMRQFEQPRAREAST